MPSPENRSADPGAASDLRNRIAGQVLLWRIFQNTRDAMARLVGPSGIAPIRVMAGVTAKTVNTRNQLKNERIEIDASLKILPRPHKSEANDHVMNYPDTRRFKHALRQSLDKI
jgi:hypothetical protein